MTLPADYGHISLPLAAHLAANPATRAWISGYSPRGPRAALPAGDDLDTRNILHAADIWYSVKKHWCLEAQRLIRAKRRARRCPAVEGDGAQRVGPAEPLPADDAALARACIRTTRVHVVRIPQPFGEVRGSRSGSAGALEAHGLTGLVLDRRRRRFRLRGRPGRGGARGPAGGCGSARRRLPRDRAAAQPAVPARAARESVPLLRGDRRATRSISASPTIISSPAANRSRCCSTRSRRRARRRTAVRRGPTPELYPATYRGLFLRHPVVLLKGLLASRSSSRRRAVRSAPDTGGRTARTTGSPTFASIPDEFAALRRAAKAWGVTLNDLFLAGLLLALSPLAADGAADAATARARGGFDRERARGLRRRAASACSASSSPRSASPTRCRRASACASLRRTCTPRRRGSSATSSTCRRSWRSACRA